MNQSRLVGWIEQLDSIGRSSEKLQDFSAVLDPAANDFRAAESAVLAPARQYGRSRGAEIEALEEPRRRHHPDAWDIHRKPARSVGDALPGQPLEDRSTLRTDKENGPRMDSHGTVSEECPDLGVDLLRGDTRHVDGRLRAGGQAGAASSAAFLVENHEPIARQGQGLFGTRGGTHPTALLDSAIRFSDRWNRLIMNGGKRKKGAAAHPVVPG
jgi:hypothetical protein